MTLLQKISELNSKGITVTFIPMLGVSNSSTSIMLKTKEDTYQNYILTEHSMTTSEEWLIVGIIGDMEKKLYKSN